MHSYLLRLTPREHEQAFFSQVPSDSLTATHKPHPQCPTVCCFVTLCVQWEQLDLVNGVITPLVIHSTVPCSRPTACRQSIALCC